MSPMVYWLSVSFMRLFMKVLTRFHVSGLENLPPPGPAVFLTNHISHFDPHIIAAACWRRIDWVGSEVLFRSAVTNWYFKKCHVIKVRQYEADHAALREAIKRCKDGRTIGIFPEGGIRAGDLSVVAGSKFELYDGAFMIAQLSRAPLVPALVIGTDRLYNPASLFKRPPAWIRFGKPIAIQGKGRDEVNRLREEFVKSLRLLAEELRAEGIIQDDDWPQTPQQRNPRIPPPKQGPLAETKQDPVLK
jgi:1-acyl-sn-glycerol-3-phosphate acyltransferase